MKRLLCAALCGCILLAGCQARDAEPDPTETVPSVTETVPVQTLPPETQPPQTEPTEPPIVEVGRATITVTGDIMSHMPVINAGRQGSGYNYDSFFDHIRDTVSAADLAVANLETTLAGTGNGDRYSGFPKFNCPDAMADALKNAGFDLILTANNHSYDTGAYGMERTQEVLADRGLLNLGTTLSAAEPKYRIADLNGIRVGLICYTYGEIDAATGQKSVNGLPITMELTGCINVFDYEKLDAFYAEIGQDLADMRAEGAEALVLFIHWGNEYRTSENSYQREIAQKMCDLGVDVIVGGHPHVVQGVDLLTGSGDTEQRTLCAYSVGNAVSNQRSTNMDMETGHTEDGVLFSFTFVQYSDGAVYLDSAALVPTWLWKGYRDGTADYAILPLTGESEAWAEQFSLSRTDLAKARASCERTMETVSPGLEKAEAYLSQSREQRAQMYQTAEEGVG